MEPILESALGLGLVSRGRRPQAAYPEGSSVGLQILRDRRMRKEPALASGVRLILGLAWLCGPEPIVTLPPPLASGKRRDFKKCLSGA